MNTKIFSVLFICLVICFSTITAKKKTHKSYLSSKSREDTTTAGTEASSTTTASSSDSATASNETSANVDADVSKDGAAVEGEVKTETTAEKSTEEAKTEEEAKTDATAESKTEASAEVKSESLLDKGKNFLNEVLDTVSEKMGSDSNIQIVVNATPGLAIAGDVSMKADKKGGKISFGKGSKKVTIKVSEVTEKDADGNEVGKNGKNRHSLMNSNQLNFDLSSIVRTDRDGVDCYKYSAVSNGLIAENTKFTLELYLFREDGTIKYDSGEEVEVKAGDMKFNIIVDNWVFCKPEAECTEESCCKKGNRFEVGQYLDVVLEIKSGKDGEGMKAKKQKMKAQKKLKSQIEASASGADVELETEATVEAEAVAEVEFGNGENINFNNEIFVDGEQQHMPEGYPLIEEGKKNSITLRFPHFTKRAVYDPIASVGGASEGTVKDDQTTTTTTTKVEANSSSNLISLSLSLLALVFLF